MRRGFTLIEVVVVLGILSILMAIGVPNYMIYMKDTEVLAMQQDLAVIQDHVALYLFENTGPLGTPKTLQEGEARHVAKVYPSFVTGSTYYLVEGQLASSVLKDVNAKTLDDYCVAHIDGEYIAFHMKGVEDSEGIMRGTLKTWKPVKFNPM